MARRGEQLEKFEAGLRGVDVVGLHAALGATVFDQCHLQGAGLPFPEAVVLAKRGWG